MEHPGVDIKVIREMAQVDLQKKIAELYTRLSYATRTGNGALVHQVQMVLEVYLRASQEKLAETFDTYAEENGFDGISIDT